MVPKLCGGQTLSISMIRSEYGKGLGASCSTIPEVLTRLQSEDYFTSHQKKR